MRWVAGVDGCKGGWFVVFRETTGGELRSRAVGSFQAVLELEEAPAVICIDIPIGLLDRAVPGGRDCDREIRALLGPGRAGSVFSPPARPTLKARGYQEAVRLNRAGSSHRIGISRQCWGILPKIREVDALVTPRLQRRVREAHPEVAFFEMNGGKPVELPKRSREGHEYRVALLERSWGVRPGSLVSPSPRVRGEGRGEGRRVARDDIVDAMALCWTAERVLRKEAARVPARPPVDEKGLWMEIVR